MAAPTVRVIQTQSDLLHGPAAMSRPGDVLLENNLIRVVVSAPDHPLGAARSGGWIIDAAPVGEEDSWGQAVLALNDDFPRQARYDSMEIFQGDGRAGVRLMGVDSRNDQVRITTTYQIHGGDPFVSVTTEFGNDLRTDLADVVTADRFALGLTIPFLPHFGFLGSGEPAAEEPSPDSPIILFWSEDVCYGWYSSNALTVQPRMEGSVSLPIRPFGVRAKSTTTLRRKFYVWDSDLITLYSEVSGRSTVPVLGRVIGDGGGGPAAGALVEIRSQKGIIGYARTDADGRFRAPLEPGLYKAAACYPGGATGRWKSFNAALEQSREISLRLPEQGEVRFQIEKGGGGVLAGEVIVRMMDGSRMPATPGRFPPIDRVRTATGSGRIRLPKGDYRLTATAGNEFSVHSQEIEIDPGDSLSLTFYLKREIDPGDLVSVDLHQHTIASLDCPITLSELKAASAAAGLDIIVIADQGFVHDEPSLNNNGPPLVIGGEEVRLTSVGRFGLFPVTPEGAVGSVGSGGPEGKSPTQLFRIFRNIKSKPLVHVHSPRDPANGYFGAIGLDPSTGLTNNVEESYDFDLIEVVSLGGLDEASRVLQDWFHLLNLGKRLFATGNSGVKSLDPGTIGLPKNYVDLRGNDPSPEALAEALRSGRLSVSTGPLLQMTANGRGEPGDLLAGGDGLVDLVVEIDAPGWIHLDRLRIFGNGGVVAEKQIDGGGDPTHVRITESVAIYQDTWLVAVVTGRRSLDPIAVGPNGESVRPVAFTNPIWVDWNLNGKFDPPGVR